MNESDEITKMLKKTAEYKLVDYNEKNGRKAVNMSVMTANP